MFELEPNSIVWLTILAGFSQSIVLAITLFVFYKNLLVLKTHNTLTIERFTFQSNVEKYDLTLKFVDWVKTELSDYIPYVMGDAKHDYLTKDEIQEHFDNIAKNMIKLIESEVVFKSLMTDEIKKMYVTLVNINSDDKYISKLKMLQDNDTADKQD